MKGLDRGVGVVTSWITVILIAAYSALQMLDRKLQLGASSYLPGIEVRFRGVA